MNVVLVSILLFLVIAGSVVFHILSPWWFSPLASNWGSIDNSVLITFWVTGFVFVVLSLFLIYCVWKYRYKKNRKAEYKPEK